jgi:hypothetical protein
MMSRRVKPMRRSKKPARPGCSQRCSTCEMKPGMNSRSVGASPAAVHAIVASALRA